MTQVIYTTLINKIKSTLNSVTNVKAVYARPISKLGNVYPAAIFYPSAVENEFDSNGEDSRRYSFDLFIVVGSKGTTRENIFETVLPNTVDAVLEAFATNWDGGNIDGHRVKMKIDSGVWGTSVENDSEESWAQFNILIELNINN